jgi:hypothetical protein
LRATLSCAQRFGFENVPYFASQFKGAADEGIFSFGIEARSPLQFAQFA